MPARVIVEHESEPTRVCVVVVAEVVVIVLVVIVVVLVIVVVIVVIINLVIVVMLVAMIRHFIARIRNIRIPKTPVNIFPCLLRGGSYMDSNNSPIPLLLSDTVPCPNVGR